MTESHFSWHLIPSVFYKRLCRVLWGFFLCVAYTYFNNGYYLLSFIILSIAILGYQFISVHPTILNIYFHAGVWKVGAHYMVNLQIRCSTPYWLVLSGEEIVSHKTKQVIVFRDQFVEHNEHAFRWVVKQMSHHY